MLFEISVYYADVVKYVYTCKGSKVIVYEEVYEIGSPMVYPLLSILRT